MNLQDEHQLFLKMQKGDNAAFEEIFRLYYQPLCFYALRIMQSDEKAEELVQDFFVSFWEKRNQIQIETSLKSYLFRSVKNQCLNRIKHEQIKLEYARKVIADAETSDYSDHFLEVDLKKDIEESIASLPEKRQEIFRLSREEGLKYREIAEKLDISIKTVEAQMGLAIKTLREKLKKYNSFLFFLACFRKKTK
jgi:RNA polymerase sigma-70 factor, ECF subfamily